MIRLNRTAGVVLALGLIVATGHPLDASESSSVQSSDAPSPQDNKELRRMYNEDQGDRSAHDARTIDWAVVAPRDRARRDRVRAILAEGRLVTANDYYHAGMIFQHGKVA